MSVDRSILYYQISFYMRSVSEGLTSLILSLCLHGNENVLINQLSHMDADT